MQCSLTLQPSLERQASQMENLWASGPGSVLGYRSSLLTSGQCGTADSAVDHSTWDVRVSCSSWCIF